jgi:hypothetical protein
MLLHGQRPPENALQSTSWVGARSTWASNVSQPALSSKYYDTLLEGTMVTLQ